MNDHQRFRVRVVIVPFSEFVYVVSRHLAADSGKAGPRLQASMSSLQRGLAGMVPIELVRLGILVG